MGSTSESYIGRNTYFRPVQVDCFESMVEPFGQRDAEDIGRIVVEQGFATHDEVREVTELWHSRGGAKGGLDFAQLMVVNQILTENQLQRILKQIAEHEPSRHQLPGYKILERLGAGAMASVYKARQVETGEIVAVKVLPKRSGNDPQFVRRFHEEGRAAASLDHKGLIRALDSGQGDDYHFIVMEYVEGHTVFDYLAKHGAYPEARCVEIVIAVAEALEHAHEAGFVHRDIKPKNIMITTEGDVKLADMGLARQMNDRVTAQTEVGKAFGTPFYISPEQVRGTIDVDQRADIYGLGATFYHMATGEVPFDGANPSNVMHKHLLQDLRPPIEVNPDLSVGVSEIIEVMMTKDRERRYATMSRVLEDLYSTSQGDAPLIARQLSDVHARAELEDTAIVPKKKRGGLPAMMMEPLFWVAAGSLVLNLVLIVLMMMG